MNRRNLFKMLGTLAASAVCVPLAKLIPQAKPEVTITRRGYYWHGEPPLVKITHFADAELALSEEDFRERVIRPWAKRMADLAEADALQRYHATADLKFVVGDEWPS